MNAEAVWALLKTLLPTFVDVDPDDLTLETELSSLGVDSLDLVELQVEFQKRLGVKIPSSVFATGEVKTILELIAYVGRQQSSAA